MIIKKAIKECNGKLCHNKDGTKGESAARLLALIGTTWRDIIAAWASVIGWHLGLVRLNQPGMAYDQFNVV